MYESSDEIVFLQVGQEDPDRYFLLFRKYKTKTFRVETKFLLAHVLPVSGLVQKPLPLRDSVDFGEAETL